MWYSRESRTTTNNVLSRKVKRLPLLLSTASYPTDPGHAMAPSCPAMTHSKQQEALDPVSANGDPSGAILARAGKASLTRPTSWSPRRTSRSNFGISHGGPSSRDSSFVVSPRSTELERLLGPGRGITVVMPAARSTPLTIAFLKLRGLRWGSCRVVATKNMGHSRTRRSVVLEAKKKGTRGSSGRWAGGWWKWLVQVLTPGSSCVTHEGGGTLDVSSRSGSGVELPVF